MPPYSELDIKKALDLHKGGLSLAKVSKLVGVPKTTLHNRKNGMVSARQAFEKHQKLSTDWERTLVSYIIQQNQLGLTPTHSQVTNYLASRGQSTTLGKNYLCRFIKRHPEIAESRAQYEKDLIESAALSRHNEGAAASSRDIEGATSSRDIEGGSSSRDTQSACHMYNKEAIPTSLLRKIEKRMSDQTAELVQLREEIGHLRNEVKALSRKHV